MVSIIGARASVILGVFPLGMNDLAKSATLRFCRKQYGFGFKMKTTQSELEARIRQTPLVERLRTASVMIGRMAHDQRPPKMSIPVQPYDEDVFITVTLADAIDAIEGKQ